MKKNFDIYVPLMLVFALCVCGCSSSTVTTLVDVSGTVTLDDVPLENVQVFMQPIETSAGETQVAAFGKTDASGRYVLATTENPSRPGAMPGKQRVFISFDWMIPENATPEQIAALKLPELPMEWKSGILTFVVPPEGTDKADFSH